MKDPKGRPTEGEASDRPKIVKRIVMLLLLLQLPAAFIFGAQMAAIGAAVVTSNYSWLNHANWIGSLVVYFLLLTGFVALVLILAIIACTFCVGELGRTRRALLKVDLLVALVFWLTMLLVSPKIHHHLPQPNGTMRWADASTLEWSGGRFHSLLTPQVAYWTEQQQRASGIVLVIRDNGGGQMAEAERLFATLDEHGITHVHIEGICASACTQLFAQATSRSMADDALLKFHAVYKKDGRLIEDAYARYRAFTEPAGFHPSIFERSRILAMSDYLSVSRDEITACAPDGSTSCVQLHERPLPASASGKEVAQ